MCVFKSGDHMTADCKFNKARPKALGDTNEAKEDVTSTFNPTGYSKRGTFEANFLITLSIETGFGD